MARNQEGVRHSYVLSSKAQSEFKRLSNAVKLIMEEVFDILSENPALGDNLKGKLEGLRSYHVDANGVPYRVVYRANLGLDGNEVKIEHIGTRNDFYKKLSRRRR